MPQTTIKTPQRILELTAVLLLVLVASLACATPAIAGEPAGQHTLILKARPQQSQLTPSPYPLVEPTPQPYPFDERPDEHNPYLISGGVLIFAVILLALVVFSRRKLPEE